MLFDCWAVLVPLVLPDKKLTFSVIFQCFMTIAATGSFQ